MHQPGAAIDRIAEQMQILLDESLGCIDHDDRDVGRVDRGERFHDRKFLDDVVDFAFAATPAVSISVKRPTS